MWTLLERKRNRSCDGVALVMEVRDVLHFKCPVATQINALVRLDADGVDLGRDVLGEGLPVEHQVVERDACTRAERVLAMDDPANPGAVISAETECQPLRTFRAYEEASSLHSKRNTASGITSAVIARMRACDVPGSL